MGWDKLFNGLIKDKLLFGVLKFVGAAVDADTF